MNPQEAAQTLLDDVGITTFPVVPQEICNRLKINYFEQPFDGFEGTILFGTEVGTIIGVNSNIAEQGRKNFTCAHELGHYCMDFGTTQKCAKADMESYRKSIREIEGRANRFASELIFPRSFVPANLLSADPDWDTIRNLSTLAQASLQASANRFIDLTYQPCALIVTENGRITYARHSRSFAGMVDITSRGVSKSSTAHAAHTGASFDNEFVVIKADIWLPSNRKTRQTEILEWSLPKNSYGQVLTLLWNDSEEDFEEAESDSELLSDDDDVSTEWEPPTFHKSKRKA